LSLEKCTFRGVGKVQMPRLVEWEVGNGKGKWKWWAGGRESEELALLGPDRELVAGRELQLAEDR
jgi:hypothetical protein